jgi:hypothetical protein
MIVVIAIMVISDFILEIGGFLKAIAYHPPRYTSKS